MKLGTFFEKVKAALQSQVCLHCEQPLQEAKHPFCLTCRKTLNICKPQALIESPVFTCHAASRFNPAIKRLLYDYKFHRQTENASQLSGLLITYWESLIAKNLSATHPENTLVLSIPAHGGKPAHVDGFARRFARHFGYDYRPTLLQWQRTVEPQHSIHQKNRRFANIANSLHVHQPGITEHERIVVIDDLTTTGATLQEANRALRTQLYHPEQLDIITLAVSHVPLSFYGR